MRDRHRRSGPGGPGGGSGRAARAAAVLAAAALLPGLLGAQERCAPALSAPATTTPTATSAGLVPALSRTVTLAAGTVPLRDALGLLAEAAGIRLSYSGELLPLAEPVCASVAGVTVGGALSTLLGSAPVRPVELGADHVVLTPAPATAPTEPARAPTEPPVYELAELVVTGRAEATEPTGDPFAREVLDGEEIHRRGIGAVGRPLGLGVPGGWAWGAAGGSGPRHGGGRGASSFGVSVPKVFIDGIEVANPLLLTRLAPEAIERIEVIRGPQGAALYGAGAIGGVTNIVTRRGTARDGAPSLQVQTSFGRTASAFAPGGSLALDQAVSLSAGSKFRSAGFDLAFGDAGGSLPGAFSRHLAARAYGRLVGARTVVDATVRFHAEHAADPVSPFLQGLAPDPAAPGPTPAYAPLGMAPATDGALDRSVRQYTAGVTASFLQNERWSHTVTVGIDGYALDGAWGEDAPLPSAADSALRAARGTGLQATLRVTSTGRYQNRDGDRATLTLSAEHSSLHSRTAPAWAEGVGTAPLAAVPGAVPAAATTGGPLASSSRTSMGFSGRVDASLDDRLFLSGGVRLESTDHVAGFGRLIPMPVVGAAYLVGGGPVSVKLRTAWGRGIRWPQLSSLAGASPFLEWEALRSGLGPEVQSGVEAGVDVTLGRALTLRATRFDQTASGLVQRVAFSPGALWGGRDDGGRLAWRLESVGQITNRGWELEAALERGPLALDAAVSLVDSRVRRLARAYSGDLREGDRPLEVPARSVSLTASWDAAPWFTSVSAIRAGDWVNYDRLALAGDLAAEDAVPGDFVGERLRSYWQTYTGVTHLRATLERRIAQSLTLTLTGDNLLNRQVGEPDNLTILPGRTLWIGFRASF